jgi:hypothetical protein
MKYEIEEQGSELAIKIEQRQGKQEILLKSFQECREGRCACPTDEYRKLEAMAVQAGADAITLQLKAKPGERWVISEIEQCLQHTVGKATQE